MLQSQVQIHEQARPNKPRKWTNNILVQHQTNRVTYFIPCYLRLKVKSIQSVDITKMEGQISCDILFTVYYGPLARFLVSQLKSNIILEFSRNSSIALYDNEFMTITHNYEQHTLSFTIRNTSKTSIQGDLRFSPFELLRMKLIVSVRSIVVQKEESEDGIQIVLRFNLMDSPIASLKLSYGTNTTFQSYCLAPSHTYACYTNHILEKNQPIQHSYYLEDRIDNYIQHLVQQVQKKKRSSHECRHERIKHFQYAHFYIGIYRYPLASVATVYVPMWSMAFYNLFVFFQYLNDLAMKINNSLVILLALFVYLPTIRSQIPDKPYLIVSQMLLLIICLTFILNLISGVYFQQQVFAPDPNNPRYYQIDFWFYVSVGLVVFTFVAVLGITIVHKLCWQPSYLKQAGQGNARQKFSHKKWGNKHADLYFQKFDCLSVIY